MQSQWFPHFFTCFCQSICLIKKRNIESAELSLTLHNIVEDTVLSILHCLRVDYFGILGTFFFTLQPTWMFWRLFSQPRWRKNAGKCQIYCRGNFHALLKRSFKAMDRSYGRGKIGNAKGAGSCGWNRSISTPISCFGKKNAVFLTGEFICFFCAASLCGAGVKYFLCSHLLGEDSNFD